MIGLRTDLAIAFSTLTRLPLAWLWPRDPIIDPARSVWAYPVVGAVIGMVGSLTFWTTIKLGAPSSIAGIWTMAVLLLTTGALHEDGLADTADGFGGGRTRARKLEIMRDSRIGSYGACALMLSLALRASAIASLPNAATAIVAACVLSRTGVLLVLLTQPPARTDGLGASIARPPAAALVIAGVFSTIMIFAILPPRIAALAIPIAGITSLIIGRFARSQIGGHTGDVLGATIVAVECVLLSMLALRP